MSAVRRINTDDQTLVRVAVTRAAGVAVGPWVLTPDDADSLCHRLAHAAAEARRAARIRDGRVRVLRVGRDGAVRGEVDAPVVERNRALVCVTLDGAPHWFDLSDDGAACGRRNPHLLDPGDREVLLSTMEDAG